MSKKLVTVGLLYSALWCLALPAQTNGTSANDEDFIEFAGETDLTAARLGQMAQSQSSAQEVKQFGRSMAQEHMQDLKKLTAVANKIGAIAPNSLDNTHKQVISRFSNLKGQAFDRQFLKEMSDRHANAIGAYKREAGHGFNADLKAYAAAALPHLEEHLKRAQALAGGE